MGESNIGLITAIFIIGMFICTLFIIIFIIGLMKVFSKCNKPAWISLIPFYNLWVLFKIVGVPSILSLIPFVNAIVLLYVLFLLGSKFNKSTLFKLGLVIFTPIFLIILGFDSSVFIEAKEEKLKPDLMAKDPASEGVINLMEADPINTIPDVPKIQEESSIKEMPSLEQQLEIPKTESSEKIDIPQDEVKQDIIIPDVFNMKLPKNQEEELITNEEETNNQEPVEELQIEENSIYKNSHKTQKFCSQCGSPNDVLNKFCISCGYNFEASK